MRQISYNSSNFFQDVDFADPCRRCTEDEVREMNLRYYNYEVHKAAFVLPQFAKVVSIFI